MLVLKNCKLIPELCEGTDLKTADLFLENEKIVKIASCGTDVLEGAEVMDMAGQYVLPGFILGHVHLFEGEGPKDGWGSHQSAATRVLASVPYAQYLLKIGYTTVRDCGDHESFATIDIRDRINSGLLEGPRLYCSGPIIEPYVTDIENFLDEVMGYRTNDECMAACRTVMARFADFIKVYGTGSMMAAGNNPDACIMTDEEMQTAVKIADIFGSYVAIHCHGDAAIQKAIKNGIRTIEHATFISDETCRMLDGRTDVGLILTTSLIWNWLHEDPISPVHQTAMTRTVAALKNAYKYNILMGWGSDISLAVQKQCPGMEFKIRKELLEYGNLDMLKQATINTAILMKTDDIMGSIKEGKLADLVVFDKDPVEDITVTYPGPKMVFKGGKLVTL